MEYDFKGLLDDVIGKQGVTKSYVSGLETYLKSNAKNAMIEYTIEVLNCVNKDFCNKIDKIEDAISDTKINSKTYKFLYGQKVAYNDIIQQLEITTTKLNYENHY